MLGQGFLILSSGLLALGGAMVWIHFDPQDLEVGVFPDAGIKYPTTNLKEERCGSQVPRQCGI